MEYKILLLFVAPFIGALSGFASGFFGIGGGIITVPALLYYFGVLLGPEDPNLLKLSIGTSLAASIVTSLFSFLKHIKISNNQVAILKWMIPGILLGAFCGFFLTLHFKIFFFKKALSFLFLLLAALLFFKTNQKETEFRKTSTIQAVKSSKPFIILSFVIGVINGAFGISGGSFAVPLLEKQKMSFKDAIALSSGIALATTVISSTFYLFTKLDLPEKIPGTVGSIDFLTALLLSLLSAITAQIGASLTKKVSTKTLKKAFALLLILLSINLYLDL